MHDYTTFEGIAHALGSITGLILFVFIAVRLFRAADGIVDREVLLQAESNAEERIFKSVAMAEHDMGVEAQNLKMELMRERVRKMRIDNNAREREQRNPSSGWKSPR